METYILCSAIWFKDGKKHLHQPINIDRGYVLCGRRHHNCIANSVIFDVKLSDIEHVQGFLTNDDYFVTREEGAKIAKIVGQIKEDKRILTSEDLW